MPELSKTARASQVKEVKEKHAETIDEAIKALRLDREAHIWPNCERIDKLLLAYDSIKLEALLVPGLQDSLHLKNDALIALGEENKRLGDEVARMAEALAKYDPIQIDSVPAEALGSDAPTTTPEHQHEIDRMADEGCPHV